MTKVLMHGCNGRMGRIITALVQEDDQVEIVAGVDAYQGAENSYPVFDSLEKCDVDADALIDFTNASALGDVLQYCVKKKMPVILCSTGYSKEQLQDIKKASRKTAILKSANMSLGINLLLKLLKDAAKVLGPAGYDIEVLERHHNQKLDAPSGTALALADSVNEAMDGVYEYVYDRSTVRKKREKKEIGISAVRGGTIVGEHEVIFAGTDEVITFQHTAYSRSVFGKGAVEAAKFLAGKPAGMYDMSDVIRL
ncbi:MAG: 4-hydroxy-tetrahydrodipicolinate reductase [Ruminococcus sp.]|nr:4-hydroxy-tetrahydrodipicolinate reductase [Ruminococcus sp.]